MQDKMLQTEYAATDRLHCSSHIMLQLTDSDAVIKYSAADRRCFSLRTICMLQQTIPQQTNYASVARQCCNWSLTRQHFIKLKQQLTMIQLTD